MHSSFCPSLAVARAPCSCQIRPRARWRTRRPAAARVVWFRASSPARPPPRTGARTRTRRATRAPTRARSRVDRARMPRSTTTPSSRRRLTMRTRSGSERRGGRQSDAILSCPCCLEIVTIDCQKHAARDDQWRAMFVRNVRVDESVAYRPASSNGKNAPDLENGDGPYFQRAVRRVRHAGGRARRGRGVPLLQRVPHERLVTS